MPSVPSRPPRFSTDDAVRFARDLFGLEAEARELVSYVDQNFLMREAVGERWILKIANEDEDESVLDFQHRALDRLAAAGLGVPLVRPAVNGKEILAVMGEGAAIHLVRLLSFLPGTFLADERPHSPALLTSLGDLLGRLDAALAGFSHPAMHRRLTWDLKNPAAARELAWHIASSDGRARVEKIFDDYDRYVVPSRGGLRTSVIHNDANDHNVLVDGAPESRIASGIIDFGDMLVSYTVGELAIAATYAALGKDDPIAAIAAVVAGYHASCPLAAAEIAVLYDLVLTRLATSVSASARAKKLDPDNDYLTVTERPAWELLRTLSGTSRQLAHNTFRKAASHASA